MEIDFDKNILKINGQKIEDKVIVRLPGLDGYKYAKLFNAKQGPGNLKKIDVCYSES